MLDVFDTCTFNLVSWPKIGDEILDFTKLNMAAVSHLGSVRENRRTTHQGPFMVAMQPKNFVMIGRAVLKL